MKTRNIILLAVVALFTLSFTFIGVNGSFKKEQTTAATAKQQEPVGGFASEEVVK
jgi:hypothetical protein